MKVIIKISTVIMIVAALYAQERTQNVVEQTSVNESDFVYLTNINTEYSITNNREIDIDNSENIPTQNSDPSEALSTQNETLYNNYGQENYRFPKRDTLNEFEFNVDGFYEVKYSGRNFSPKDLDAPIRQTILKDPIYRKIPADIRVGSMRPDFRSNIQIEGSLAENVHVYYNIQQEPDIPDVYDVQIEYKDHEIKFFHFNTAFLNGEYLNLTKALKGVEYTYNNPKHSVKIASGKQRSSPQQMQGYGNGQKKIKLKHRYIFKDSVRVYVNDKEKNPNTEYTIDYFEGEITFNDPPQVTDFYKIIYEHSNPIADYIPSLARKGFLGIDYKYRTKNTVENQVKMISVTEKLTNKGADINKSPQQDMLKIVTQNFLENPIFEEDEIPEIIAFLKNEHIIDDNNTLKKDYNPEAEYDVFETPDRFTDRILHIKSVIDFVYFDYLNMKQQEEIKSEVRYINVIIKPSLLLDIEYLTKEDTDAIYVELIENNIINHEGKLRVDILNIDTIFKPESTYKLYNETAVLNVLKTYFLDHEDYLKAYIYKLENSPIVLGSETITVNDIQLTKNKDYFIDLETGKLTFNLYLDSTDKIVANYNYYVTKTHEEDIIGQNAVGPYKLEFSNIVNGSVAVKLNNKIVTELDDFTIDYEKGEINFNYEILYPSHIYIQYKFKEVETIIKKTQKQKTEFDITYVEETVPEDIDSLVLTVVSENINATIATENIQQSYLQLENFPIVNSANIVVISEQNGKINPTDYTIDTYAGIIDFVDPDSVTDGEVFYVDYNYLKSYQTYVGINKLDNTNTINSLDYNEFIQMPIKYNGVRYIIYKEGDNDIYLTNGVEFTVNYIDDGDNIEIIFQKYSENNSSLLNTYPVGNMTIFYDYSPDTTLYSQSVYKKMVVSKFKTAVTDSLDIQGEVAISGDNYASEEIEGELEETQGTGVDNDRYYLGQINIVEESEQIMINNIVLTKDIDYSINYATGYFYFKNTTPMPEDTITALFNYFESGGNLLAGDSQFAYATKLLAAYQKGNLGLNNSIKYIQRDFNPIGTMKEYSGSTIYSSDVNWKYNQKSNINSSYRYSKQFAGENNIQQEKYLRSHNISTSWKTVLLNKINTKQTLSYIVQVQDPFNSYLGDDTRNIDTYNYKYNSKYSFNLFNNTNTYVNSFSQRVNDFIDNINKTETEAQTHNYATSFKFSELPIFGKVAISPSYYTSLSKSTSADDSITKQKRNNYSVSGKSSPFKNLSLDGSYAYGDTSKENEIELLSLTKTTSYSTSTQYHLGSWFNTRYAYAHNENETPLLSAQSNVNQNKTFTIANFSPYSMLRFMGVSNELILLESIKKSRIRYSNSDYISEVNDRKKLNNTTQESIALNNIDILKGLSINNIVYKLRSSELINNIEQTTVSKNMNTSDRSSFSGTVKVEPEIELIKNISYAYSVSEDHTDSDITNFAKTVTGSATLKETFSNKQVHKFSYKVKQLYIPLNNKKNRLRLGSFSVKLSKDSYVDKNIEKNKNLFYRNDTDDYEFIDIADSISQDNKTEKSIKASGTISPLNIIDISFNISSSNVLLNRNKYSTKGTTHQNKLKTTFGTSISPLPKMSLFGSIQTNAYTQYKSPTINASVSMIMNGLTNEDPNIFTSLIDNEQQSYSGRLAYQLTSKLKISTKYSFSKTTEKVTEIDNVNDKNFETRSLEYKLTFFPIKGATIVYSLLENKHKQIKTNLITENTGTGSNLSINYTPVKTAYTKTNLNYTRHVKHGYGYNRIEQENSLTGEGDYVETTIESTDNVVEQGSINMSMIIPLVHYPHADNVTLTAEGYIKKIQDNLRSDNNYDISGVVLKGVLNF